MAVMLVATIPGQSREEQERMVDSLRENLEAQPGFLFHAGGPVDGGWRLHEVWESRDQLEAWLEGTIFPSLPEDAPTPEMDIVPIDIVVRP